MAQQYIHGVNVEYDENDASAKAYINHLNNSSSHEEMRAFMNSAKEDPNYKTHLEDSHGDYVTLVYKDDGSCHIRQRNF